MRWRIQNKGPAVHEAERTILLAIGGLSWTGATSLP